MECFDEPVVIFGSAYRQADEVATLESVLRITVLDHDIEARQELLGQFGRRIAVGHLAAEEVGLSGQHTQIGYLLKQLTEAVALGNETVAGCHIVFLVFAEYLHVELAKRVDVPDADIALDILDEAAVGRCQDA